MADKTLLQTTGRRKEAVARVRVMEGNSQIIVNGKPISEIFPGILMQRRYQKPFEITKTLGKYTATVRVFGGGQSGQLDATVHGIARSLAKIKAEFKDEVKKAGLLTRDPRARERRKYGLAHGARAKKQSPKR
jgi:small subunit ribosomal protein S9